MPIYSRNSVGSDIHITANENYSYADMGRILVECTQNDMIVFNAAMRNDFKENAAIREGTMVSSELTTFREFSIKEAWGNLKEKLKKLWEKIKGVFRQVYAKLTVWLVRNGKMFVAMHRKTLANKTGLDKVKIPKFYHIKKDPAIAMGAITTQANSFASGWKTRKWEEEQTAEKLVNEYLSNAVCDGTTADNLSENFKKTFVEETNDTTYGAIKGTADFNQLFDKITSKSDSIKKLKKMEKESDKAIKTAMKAVDSASKEKDKAEDKQAQHDYKNASASLSAFERCVTLICRQGIQTIKAEVANARQIIGKLAAASPNNESALLEQMAWFEGADDFATQEDIPAEEINADDVQSDPDVVVNVEVEPSECNA